MIELLGDNHTFGKFLKQLRIYHGYRTQKQLADKSGISQTTLSRIEAGLQKPFPDTLKILAQYLPSHTYGELMAKAGYFDELTSATHSNGNPTEDNFTEEEILTLAAHQVGYEGTLTSEQMAQIKLAMRIALAKERN